MATQNTRDGFAPYVDGVAIDISAANHTLSVTSRGLYVGGAGDVIVIMSGPGATAKTFKAVPVGTLLPISVKTVVRTGTTATNLLALL